MLITKSNFDLGLLTHVLNVDTMELSKPCCLCSTVIGLAMGTDLQQLSFLGIMGLLDPPRPGVREAVHTLLESGVEVKMLTGDARETALTIGKLY